MYLRTYAPSEDSDQLHIRAVCSESSLSAFWIAKDAKFLHADNEDSGQRADALVDLSHLLAHV